MYVAFNPTHRAYMAAVDGRGEFAFHAQLAPGDDESRYAAADGAAFFRHASGMDMDVGDAAHLFTPAGGMGYNTAIEDAVNLGWKLAAVVRGHGGDALLHSYETERRAIAVRNTGFARGFADSLGNFVATPELEMDTPEGAEARRIAGEYYNQHARAEFNIPGFTLGARYDGSPVIVSDGTKPPPDGPNIYHPTACPGGRAPHMWLEDGSSLYDHFSFEWTLLRVGPADTAAIEVAAIKAGLPLKVLDLPNPDLRDLYEADAALIRPDQIVAWRSGGRSVGAPEVIARVTGRNA